jgi:MFS transporter, PPP family, 3-phenylpropionic acid transporter
MNASPALRMISAQTGIYMAHGVNMVFIVVLMALHGLTPGQIGLVMGLSNLARVIFGPCWGMLADRIGQLRLVIAMGASITILAMLTIYAADARGFVPVTALILLANVGMSAPVPLFDTLTWRSAAAGYFTFGHVRAIASVTYVIGVIAGGFVVEAAGGSSVLWMIVLGNLASLFLLPTLKAPPAAQHVGRFSVLPLLKSREYLRMMLCSTLLQGSHAAYYGFSTLLWQSEHISDRIIGALWGEGVVVEVVVMLLLRHRIARIDPWLLTMIGAGLAIIRWSGTAMTGDPLLLALLQPLHAGSFTLPYLAAMRIIGDRIPANLAATAQTVYGALGTSAPIGVMMALVSLLYPSWGAAVFWLMALMTAAGLALAVRGWRVMSGSAIA